MSTVLNQNMSIEVTTTMYIECCDVDLNLFRDLKIRLHGHGEMSIYLKNTNRHEYVAFPRFWKTHRCYKLELLCLSTHATKHDMCSFAERSKNMFNVQDIPNYAYDAHKILCNEARNTIYNITKYKHESFQSYIEYQLVATRAALLEYQTAICNKSKMVLDTLSQTIGELSSAKKANELEILNSTDMIALGALVAQQRNIHKRLEELIDSYTELEVKSKRDIILLNVNVSEALKEMP